MTERPDWDDQFAESEEERAERWRRIKARRKLLRYCAYCDANTTDLPTCPNCGHQMR